jgi:hydroxymethylglutaryl-CoA synthase
VAIWLRLIKLWEGDKKWEGVFMQKNFSRRVGIVGYGAYIPYSYVKIDEVDWRGKVLGLSKKAVACWDEDSITLGVEAGRQAIKMAGIESDKVGLVYVGSESPPYAVKPSSTVVGDCLGLTDNYQAVDMEFACKAGTAAVEAAMAQVMSGMADYGLAIGSDVSQAAPGDLLELSAGAAGAAFLLGSEQLLVECIDFLSISKDLPDFWRREYEVYPKHGNRFTGKPAYFAQIEKAMKSILEKNGVGIEQIDQVVVHMPNGKFPRKIFKDFGFKKNQWENGLTVLEVGNPYSASAMLGMIGSLEKAKANELILMVSYGSGSGSDAFLWKTTELIEKKRMGLEKLIKRRKKIDWKEYLEQRRVDE